MFTRTGAVLPPYGSTAVLQVTYMKFEAAGLVPAVEEDSSCEQEAGVWKRIIAYDREKQQWFPEEDAQSMF